MNKPNLRVIIFVALLLLTGGLRANQLSAKSSPISGLSGLEQLSSQDRIVLKSNRQLFNCTFYYQLGKDKVWLHINIFACSCELTFFAHFNWSLLAEHTSFGMGEWVHTFKWRFFFFYCLSFPQKERAFYFWALRETPTEELLSGVERWVLYNPESPVASFPVMGAGDWKPSEAEVVINESVGQRETAWIPNWVTFMYFVPDSNF